VASPYGDVDCVTQASTISAGAATSATKTITMMALSIHTLLPIILVFMTPPPWLFLFASLIFRFLKTQLSGRFHYSLLQAEVTRYQPELNAPTQLLSLPALSLSLYFLPLLI
jgi:hypothetical protein